MSMNLKNWIGLSGALVSLSIASAACGGGGGGGGATPTPTAAPLDISATDYYTISGTANIIPGECAGLEITDANAGFTTDTTVVFLDSTGAEYTVPFTVYVDGTTDDFPFVTLVSDSVIKVGLDFLPSDTTEPTGPYPCLNYGFGTLFEVGQSYGILVADGAASDTLTSVFTVGAVPAAAGTLGVEGTANGTLTAANDFDYYNVTSGGPSGATIVGLLGSGANFVPAMSLFTTSAGNFSASTNNGFYMIIERGLPNASTIRPVVRHQNPSTGAGFSYTLNVSTSGTIVTNAGNDICAFGDTAITADTVFTVDVQAAVAGNYNPNGAPGCKDANAGGTTGVSAPGKDVVYRLNVPANTTVSIGGIPNGATGPGDTVLYLLPAVTGQETANCPAAVTTCAAAADIYGAGSTDSLVYRNTTNAVQTFYLVVDEYGTGTAPGTSGPMTIAIDFQ